MLTTAQSWVLLGVLGTFVTGLLVAVSVATTSLRGEFRGLFEGQGAQFRGLFDGLRGEMSARFDAVDTRLDGVDRRLDHLDRDVQALSDRVFRDRP